jgi:hypothetical protein
VEREIVAGAVSDLVVGDHVEVLVDQPGRVVVLLREGRWTRVFVGEGHNREVIRGVGQPCGGNSSRVKSWMSLCLLV